ncbi:integral membrane protein [Purpureocillium lavendulum]|uniref:Integral membrane protein n=1 Tax=Purpureocillium lavendulum TaxID=1247861 RepID=A0AB34FKI8_9HYPO|nr:integral membrane protein [Purpureocillium lavendulum]
MCSGATRRTTGQEVDCLGATRWTSTTPIAVRLDNTVDDTPAVCRAGRSTSMSALPPPPPGIDLTQDRRPDIVATSAVTLVLAILAVVLRIVSRHIKRVPLWIDDWLIIASLPCACAHVAGIAGYAVSRGFGRHVWVNPPDSVRAWAIGLFTAELAYFFTLLCVKWSILAFYWRSFKIRQSIKVPIWTLAIIVLCWGIAVAWWQRFDPDDPLPPSEYTCGVDSRKFFYGNAIPTIVTDILMLALPTPYIWNLHLPRGQKFALAGIFLVGIFVTVVSVVRLSYLLRGDLTNPDITWNFVDIGLWSIIEGNIAIVCGMASPLPSLLPPGTAWNVLADNQKACLPFLRPVVSRVSFGILHLSSYHSKARQKQGDQSHGRSSTRKTTTTTSTNGGRSAEDEVFYDDDDSSALRTWEGDGRFGVSSSHARAFASRSGGSGGDLEADERPFVRTSPDDGRSATTVAAEGRRTVRGNNGSFASIELRDLDGGRTSPLDGIVVTREVHMQHQAV